ncbi:MAG: glycosyltransferase [Bacteroidota bacterium]
MGKICLIYNFAQHYRANIFTLMDQELDCDFVFGDKMSDVKKMDYSLLSQFRKEVQNRVILRKPLYFQKGVVSLLKEDYATYLVLGELFCISTWMILILSGFYRKRVYLWSHGFYGKEGVFRILLKKLFFSMSAGVFLYGNHARELMIEAGMNPNKLHVIYNSLDYDGQLGIRGKLFPGKVFMDHFRNRNRNLLFVGRLTRVKRLDILLEAMLLLKADQHDFNLTIIGEGEKRFELDQLAKAFGLEENIWFFGACYDERELSGLIFNADLCVSPGNVGLTAIHAMTYGTPVVTHDCHPLQMPEFEAIEDGVTGTFFKHMDPGSLAESIKRWFRTAPDRELVRQSCYRTIDEKYNPHKQIEVLKENLITN